MAGDRTQSGGIQPEEEVADPFIKLALMGSGLTGIAFDGTNIWVTNAGSNRVTKINPAGQTTATLSVTSLVFGNQVVGLTSASQSVTVTNSGTVAINIASISITGTNSADYAETNTCRGSLAVGTSCMIFVTFTPTAIGARTASISIFDNASNSPQTVSLTGTGVLSSGTYRVGTGPSGVAFDGTNIWVTNSYDGTVTKLLASTGATVGTYPLHMGLRRNLWVTSPIIAAEPLIDKRNCGAAQKT